MTAELTTEALTDRLTTGSAVLIAGPPMTDKFELMLELLGSANDGHVVVTTKHTAADVRTAASRATDPADPGLVGVVECLGRSGTPPNTIAADSTPATPTVRSASPGNLTGIGVGVVDALQACETAGTRRPGIGLHSLSPLLMHTNLDRVYRFVGELTGSLRRRDGIGVFVVDTTSSDSDVLSTLSHHADGVLRTRRLDGDRELRARGSFGPTEWCPY